MANTTSKGAASKMAAPKDNDEVKELKEMLEQKNKETEDLKDMIKQLSEIVKMSTQGANVNVEQKNEDIGDLVYITNNSIGKQILAIDSLGQTSIQIQPSEKNRPIERDYVRQAMQLIQMRKLFEYGILQFEDKSFYRIYGIERKFDMSEENVLDMFSVEKISTTASRLKELFKKEDTGALQHELCYKALDLVQKGRLPMEETNTINVTLNKIFCSGVNVSFNDLLSNLSIKRGEM